MGQQGSKMCQHGVNMAPRRAKMAERWTKRDQARADMGQDGTKRDQDRAKTRPRWAEIEQYGAKMGLRGGQFTIQQYAKEKSKELLSCQMFVPNECVFCFLYGQSCCRSQHMVDHNMDRVLSDHVNQMCCRTQQIPIIAHVHLYGLH